MRLNKNKEGKYKYLLFLSHSRCCSFVLMLLGSQGVSKYTGTNVRLGGHISGAVMINLLHSHGLR